MEITLPLSSLVVIAVGSVGMTVSILMGMLLLLQKARQHLSVGLLAGLLVLSGLTLLNDTLVVSGISNRIKQLYFIPIYYSLSLAPLFYLFVKSKYQHRLRSSDWLHLLIPIIQLVVYFSIGFRSVEFKSILYDQAVFRTYLQVESFLFPISLIGYTVAALRLLQRKDPAAFFWTADLKKWLTHFSLGLLVIAAMEFCFSLIEYSGSFAFAQEFPFYLIHTFLLSAFIFWISINGFKQYYPLQIFTSVPSPENAMLDEKEWPALQEKLQLLMDKDMVFLNPDLNLKLLSTYLGISEKSCSYMLNKGMNVNFNQFINGYRVATFKEKIQEGQNKHFTLTSIAYECGFSSKSTFNRVFKTTCGMTPSAFVKAFEHSIKSTS